VPEQAIGLDDALTAYTEGPARLAGTWPRLGMLDPGAEADLVLWDRDLHSVEEDLATARPQLTVLGGTIVYEDLATGAEARRGAATEGVR
jgi:predicted amidohydrolase YtcJ